MWYDVYCERTDTPETLGNLYFLFIIALYTVAILPPYASPRSLRLSLYVWQTLVQGRNRPRHRRGQMQTLSRSHAVFGNNKDAISGVLTLTTFYVQYRQTNPLNFLRMALLLKEITTERISRQQFATYLKHELLPLDKDAECRERAQKIFNMFGRHFSVHVACVLTYGAQVERFDVVYKALKRVYYGHGLNMSDRYKLDPCKIELIRKDLEIWALEFETKTKQTKEKMPVAQVA